MGRMVAFVVMAAVLSACGADGEPIPPRAGPATTAQGLTVTGTATVGVNL